jgi:ATP phosphoribosyltransferase
MALKNSSPPGNSKFAIPKKGRLHDKVVEMLSGAGIEFRRAPRLDVALCVGLPITLVFLPAADIAKYVGEGNVDIGITGMDVVQESMVEVEQVMELGFGKCRLCVQAPVESKIKNVEDLAGKRIVTSFPDLTRQFFEPLDKKLGVTTSVKFVSGSVEAACGLGLADGIVDLVETGTTMEVRSLFPLLSFLRLQYCRLLHVHGTVDTCSICQGVTFQQVPHFTSSLPLTLCRLPVSRSFPRSSPRRQSSLPILTVSMGILSNL